MSFYKDSKNLKLSGSQISLTSRSDQTVLGSCNRSCSSAHSCKANYEDRINKTRPKSADCKHLGSSNCESFYWPLNHNFEKMSGGSSIRVSHFTDSSSKLLQNLLGTSDHKVISPDQYTATEKLLETSHVCETAMDKYQEEDNCLEFVTMDHMKSDFFTKDSNLVVQENVNFPEHLEEKTVRFCEGLQLDYEKKPDEKCGCFTSHENLNSCLKSKLKSSAQEKEKISNIKILDNQRTFDLNPQNNDALQIFKSSSESDIFKDSKKNDWEINCEKSSDTSRDYKSTKYHRTSANPEKVLVLPVSETNSDTETLAVSKLDEKNETSQSSNEENPQEFRQRPSVPKNCTGQKIDVSESTYDEIVQLLQALEEEDSESLNMEPKQDSPDDEEVRNTIVALPEEKVDYFSAVSSYLEEVEKSDSNFHENYANADKWNSKHFSSPRMEELVNKNSVELAHEVFSLKIQIEDQKKGIKLLKDTLAEMKEAKKVAELEHQEALQKVSSDAENLVQRHQKFIKQLLNEKKNLNETVSKLVQDLKSGEERYKRNIKAMEEKHQIEIKRAKEAQAVADKIRREKWMENKTQKIKEMTVKGLEPELSRMAARQQEEMTELRNLHKAELEAVELRAARRNSELMDELRAELTKEKERAIAKETASLRTTMEGEFEDERNKFQQYYQNLKERIRKQEEKLSNQEFEFQQRLLEYKQEEEKRKQKLIREHEENLEELRRQHSVEIRNFKEIAEAEKEVALNNYKKQQVVKCNEREAELHQQYKRERDREIEMIIEALEKETSQAQQELITANEGKLKRLKDKMEAEIKEIEASESALKDKLAETKSKLSEKEDVVTELNSQIRQLQTELNFLKKSCDEMNTERAKIKEIIRCEFESTINGIVKEKENLEKDIAVLKELHLKELSKKDEQNMQVKYEMQKELTRVYSRIKTAVSKKEKIIESLREENEAVNQKCRQLEFMLDQQRRNLLLQ